MTSALQAELKQGRPFGTLEEEASVAILRTAAVFGHALAEALKGYGITGTQYNVLRILRGAGKAGLCRNEVGERLIARVPDATRLLDRMVEMGLVSRDRDTPDRRYVTSRITAKGLKLVNELDEPIRSFDRAWFGHLGRAKLQQLLELLAQVRQVEAA
ncbi:MAG: MarR family transcriptional regulator [Gemmatimonadetes bacterium]|nr:MarR family transcriptional regulator [Gemmatimonadota bacterium]